MPVASPQDVDVSLSQGVTIRWADGHVSRYGIKYLRDHCPCATCTDAHGTGEKPTATRMTAGNALPIYQPAGHKLEKVEPVGRYALQFHFDDRHSTGIYTWSYLRELCECETCRAAPAGENTAS